MEPVVEHYRGDPQLPIYATPSCGYPLHELINIFLKPDMLAKHICTVQPLAVTQKTAFVVSVDSVDFRDLKEMIWDHGRERAQRGCTFEFCNLVLYNSQ